MVLMILSNRLVRSAWKAFHCRQHRKMTIAARGRPLWKPTSPAATHHPRLGQLPLHHQHSIEAQNNPDPTRGTDHCGHQAWHRSNGTPRRWAGGSAQTCRRCKNNKQLGCNAERDASRCTRRASYCAGIGRRRRLRTGDAGEQLLLVLAALLPQQLLLLGVQLPLPPVHLRDAAVRLRRVAVLPGPGARRRSLQMTASPRSAPAVWATGGTAQPTKAGPGNAARRRLQTVKNCNRVVQEH